MPRPKDDPKSPAWRPYIFARDQWHCRICGDRFLYSEMVRKHIADEHDEKHAAEHVRILQGRSLAAKENAMIEKLNSASAGLSGM
jgi:hypothetical protein